MKDFHKKGKNQIRAGIQVLIISILLTVMGYIGIITFHGVFFIPVGGILGGIGIIFQGKQLLNRF